jgi:type VI secretion system protein ImpA
MTDFDLDTLLQPVSEASPAGDDLEYDAAFLDLERIASPMAERAVGDAVKEAREPDWDKVRVDATRLLGLSKDVRIAVRLLCAWTRGAQLAGWAAGLELLHRLLHDFWSDVHPRPDAEDDDDPTARANAIAAVCDTRGALGYFRNATVVVSPRMGRFSLRDLRLASGTLKIEASHDGGPPLTLVDIEACCLDCAEGDLLAAADAASRAVAHAEGMAWLLGDRLGLAAPDLQPLLQDVRELSGFLGTQVARRCPAPAGETVPGEDATDEGQALPGIPGRIESPQDASRAIDRICDYYARSEPSSPVPLLLRRAQRLIGMDFLTLLEDLAPGGLGELRVVAGTPDEE